MKSVTASRRHARGEVHPGLIVAGVIVTLGLAWWLAQPDLARGARPATEPAPSDEQAGAEASTAAPAGDTPAGAEGPTKPLYRWTDSAGVVHFTDVPPTDRPYVEVDVHPDRNVVTLPSPVEP